MSSNGRPGFMVYFADWQPLTILNDAQFRAVFDAAFEFARSGEKIDVKDSVANMAVQMLLPRLEADAVRYTDKVAKAKAAARRGVEMRGKVETERTPATASRRQQTQPTESLITNHESPMQIQSPSQSTVERDRPTRREIEVEAERAGLKIDVAHFLADCETDGWRDSQGEPIRDWKKWLRGYAALNRAGRPPLREKVPTALAYEQRNYSEDELRAITDRSLAEAMTRLKGGETS